MSLRQTYLLTDRLTEWFIVLHFAAKNYAVLVLMFQHISIHVYITVQHASRAVQGGHSNLDSVKKNISMTMILKERGCFYHSLRD